MGLRVHSGRGRLCNHGRRGCSSRSGLLLGLALFAPIPADGDDAAQAQAWYLVDVPLVACPGAPGEFELALSGDDISADQRDEEWMVEIFRSTNKTVSVTLDMVDSSPERKVVAGGLTVDLIDLSEKERRLRRLLRSDADPWEAGGVPPRSLGFRLPMIKGGGLTGGLKARPSARGGRVGPQARVGGGVARGGTAARMSVITAETRFANGEYEDAVYGYTGRPNLVGKANLVMGPDELQPGSEFNYSRYKTFLSSYPSECKEDGRKVKCSACSNSTGPCEIAFLPQGILVRDELIVARFLPKELTWPLKVKVSNLRGDDLTPDRLCHFRDEPWPSQDMFLRLSTVGLIEPEGDVGFQQALKESHGGLGLVVFLLIPTFLCGFGCCCLGLMYYKYKQDPAGYIGGTPESDYD